MTGCSSRIVGVSIISVEKCLGAGNWSDTFAAKYI